MSPICISIRKRMWFLYQIEMYFLNFLARETSFGFSQGVQSEDLCHDSEVPSPEVLEFLPLFYTSWFLNGNLLSCVAMMDAIFFFHNNQEIVELQVHLNWYIKSSFSTWSTFHHQIYSHLKYVQISLGEPPHNSFP